MLPFMVYQKDLPEDRKLRMQASFSRARIMVLEAIINVLLLDLNRMKESKCVQILEREQDC